jgi:hypothetical protein
MVSGLLQLLFSCAFQQIFVDFIDVLRSKMAMKLAMKSVPAAHVFTDELLDVALLVAGLLQPPDDVRVGGNIEFQADADGVRRVVFGACALLGLSCHGQTPFRQDLSNISNA